MKMLQKCKKILDKNDYIKYNFLINYRNVTEKKNILKNCKEWKV